MSEDKRVLAGLTGRLTRRLLTIQACVAAAGFLLFSWLSGAHEAWSAMAGGAIGFLTTGFFALRVFSGGADRPAKDIVRAFYLGESQKILLTVALFAVAIVWLQVDFLPMFLTYMASLAAFWIILLPVVSGTQE
jgi:ATP synthase protein I